MSGIGLGLRRTVFKALLALRQLEWIAASTVLLLAAASAIWLLALPRWSSQAADTQRVLANAEQALLSVREEPAQQPRTIDQERLSAFHALLGERHYAEQQVKTLFAVAAKSGLVLSQAEYKPGVDQNGGYATYQIVLPVKGPYLSIRAFCEQALLAIPFASLDDIGFKRESIGSSMLEARLRFTLYLDEGGRVVPNGEGRNI